MSEYTWEIKESDVNKAKQLSGLSKDFQLTKEARQSIANKATSILLRLSQITTNATNNRNGKSVMAKDVALGADILAPTITGEPLVNYKRCRELISIFASETDEKTGEPLPYSVYKEAVVRMRFAATCVLYNLINEVYKVVDKTDKKKATKETTDAALCNYMTHF
jgi:hypothetical protein